MDKKCSGALGIPIYDIYFYGLNAIQAHTRLPGFSCNCNLRAGELPPSHLNKTSTIHCCLSLYEQKEFDSGLLFFSLLLSIVWSDLLSCFLMESLLEVPL